MEIEDFGEADFDAVPYVPTRYGNIEQFAYFVEGQSMVDASIPGGSYVICVDYGAVRSSVQQGDVVVAERRRGSLVERACKQVEIVDGALCLISQSGDPRYSDPIPLDSGEETTVEIKGLVIWVLRAIS